MHILMNWEFSVCGAELPLVELMIQREYIKNKQTNKQANTPPKKAKPNQTKTNR